MSLSKGQSVAVVGLVSKPEYNGEGTIVGQFDVETGRWPVQIYTESGQISILVKEEKLLRMPKCLGVEFRSRFFLSSDEIPIGVLRPMLIELEKLDLQLKRYSNREMMTLIEREALANEIFSAVPAFAKLVKDNTPPMSMLEIVLFGHLNTYFWMLPSHEMLGAIVASAKGSIVEACAGSGFMTAVLNDLVKKDVVAFDSGDRRYTRDFAEVQSVCGSQFKFDGFGTLLLIWPEFYTSEKDPRAAAMIVMIRNFYMAGGTTLLIGGTPPNSEGRRYGCQGSQGLWDCVRTLYSEKSRTVVPSFMRGLPDCLTAFERK